MAGKRTIAIAGVKGKRKLAIANKLSLGGYRVLLVAQDDPHAIELSKYIDFNETENEIEIIECAKDGCWEADIIILAIDATAIAAIARNIRDVSTQKIVAIISTHKKLPVNCDLAKEQQRFFPHSRVINVFNLVGSNDVLIKSGDEEALQIFAGIIKTAGFYHRVIKAKEINTSIL